MGIYQRLLEMTFELGIERQKGLCGSLRFGESNITITTNNHQARHLLQDGQRHRCENVLRTLSGPAAYTRVGEENRQVGPKL